MGSINIMNSTVPDPEALIAQLQSVIDNPEYFSKHRTQITNLARKATTVFEDPHQTHLRVSYSGLVHVIARIAQNRHIFSTLVEQDGRYATLKTLTAKSGIDVGILHTILEYLVAQNMVDEVAPRCYRANRITRNLNEPVCIQGLAMFEDIVLPSFPMLKYSLDSGDRPAFELQSANGENFYAYLQRSEASRNLFFQFLKTQWEFVPSWLSVIDFGQEFCQLAEPETPVFVDVGGGVGTQCLAILRKYPTLVGKVILQDTPTTLQPITITDRIAKMPYDYFAPQPVKQARVYYLRQILHNNTHSDCVAILRNQLSAMNTSSYLLIDEKVFPDQKKDTDDSVLAVAQMSLGMVALFKAVEQHETNWYQLLDEAGFEIKRIEKYSELYDCIIIAVRKRQTATL